jgi:hypothetical protein
MYPITITEQDGTLIDRVANHETAVSVLYGDLSYHKGTPRTVTVPASPDWDARAAYLENDTFINADCWGIPLDQIVRA